MHFIALATAGVSAPVGSPPTLFLVLWMVGTLALMLVARNWFRKRRSRTPARANVSKWSEGVIAEFDGGMNTPGHELWRPSPPEWWRVQMAPPTARLAISYDTLQIRPRFGFSKIFSTFEVPLDQIASAFTVRATLLSGRAGVGFKLSDGRFAYFWTRADVSGILAVLRDRGVFIDPAQYKASPGSGELGRVAPTLLPDKRENASL